MNKNSMDDTSLTDWERIDALTDDDIDTTDIPPLGEDFFANAEWRMPQEDVAVTVKMEPILLSWFQALGNDYEQRMVAALRMYAEAHTGSVNRTISVA